MFTLKYPKTTRRTTINCLPCAMQSDAILNNNNTNVVVCVAISSFVVIVQCG